MKFDITRKNTKMLFKYNSNIMKECLGVSLKSTSPIQFTVRFIVEF